MPSIWLHIADGFPILSLTLVTEPLRVANREAGRKVFDWTVVSDDGGVRQSSSGIPVATVSPPETLPEAVILLASYHPERAATETTLAWLRRLDRHGMLLGCVDTGALVFAKAGLLGVRPAAVHSEAIHGVQRLFPKSLFVDRLYDFSPPRLSSAGGVATLDMSLALIAHFTHARIARRVAEILNYTPVLPELSVDRLPGSVPAEVRDAVSIMEANLSAPLGIAEIARQVGQPVWKLNRLFGRHLHASPTRHYVRRRLARARDMLRNTTLSVGEIAAECGYGNAEVFSRAYRAEFGCTPSGDRAL
jgi:AraC family carnitine catabolism transcriptional activator